MGSIRPTVQVMQN